MTTIPAPAAVDPDDYAYDPALDLDPNDPENNGFDPDAYRDAQI